MGRCIYTGIYDPENAKLATPEGYRKDVIEALKPLEIPVFRYPGGNFTATYHWIDGIGPREQRPKRLNLAWGGQIEDNSFGTDEFIHWCRNVMNSEPYLCLNMGTGTFDEAVNWIEYCNATGASQYAEMRRKNVGHDKPHAVKYWGLGNEVWGPWQIAQTTYPKQYAETALQWAKGIKLLDPEVKLILCGKDGISEWDYEVIKHCIQPATMSDLGVTQPPLIDYVSIHTYTASNDYHENVFAPLAAERAIETTSCLIDLACVENKIPAGQKRPLICFDEWNVWDPKRAVGSKGAEETYTLGDALAVGVWLHLFIRQSDKVGMACIAQTVNVISPLMTTHEGIVKQTSWWVYELFCKFMKGERINFVVDCEVYDGNTKPEWEKNIQGLKMRWLDVSACVERGWCTVSVVNLHQGEDIEADFGGVTNGVDVDVYLVTGDEPNVNNMGGSEKVKIKESKWKAESTYQFPKHSFTMLRWKI